MGVGVKFNRVFGCDAIIRRVGFVWWIMWRQTMVHDGTWRISAGTDLYSNFELSLVLIGRRWAWCFERPPSTIHLGRAPRAARLFFNFVQLLEMAFDNQLKWTSRYWFRGAQCPFAAQIVSIPFESVAIAARSQPNVPLKVFCGWVGIVVVIFTFVEFMFNVV